jgi:hypothetical protein
MLGNYLKDQFIKMTGIKESSISTIDHVYSSPPIRLIDSHNRLMKMKDVRVFVWDTVYPNLKRFRNELQLDTGLLSLRKKEYFVFPLDDIYALSNVLLPDYESQKRALSTILDLCVNAKDKKDIISIYLNRYDQLIEIYKNSYRVDLSSTLFYKSLIKNIYEYLRFKELSVFIDKQLEGLMDSNILNVYIPWLIEKSKNEIFGLPYLVRNSNLFKKNLFRIVPPSKKTGFVEGINNLELVVNGLASRELIPSKEVFYWAIALCNINHFGQDFCFFERLSSFLKSRGINNNIAVLQLTKDKNDGNYFVQFKEDESRKLVKRPRNGFKAIKDAHLAKSSRISNITSIYLTVGNKIKDFYSKYLLDSKTNFVDMLKIIQ